MKNNLSTLSILNIVSLQKSSIVMKDILQIYTLRRFGGLQPLCGIGVLSITLCISRPACVKARIAASRPLPGPLTTTSTLRKPMAYASFAVFRQTPEKHTEYSS